MTGSQEGPLVSASSAYDFVNNNKVRVADSRYCCEIDYVIGTPAVMDPCPKAIVVISSRPTRRPSRQYRNTDADR